MIIIFESSRLGRNNLKSSITQQRFIFHCATCLMQIIRGLCSPQKASVNTCIYNCCNKKKRELLCLTMAIQCFLLEAITATSLLIHQPKQVTWPHKAEKCNATTCPEREPGDLCTVLMRELEYHQLQRAVKFESRFWVGWF